MVQRGEGKPSLLFGSSRINSKIERTTGRSYLKSLRPFRRGVDRLDWVSSRGERGELKPWKGGLKTLSTGPGGRGVGARTRGKD